MPTLPTNAHVDVAHDGDVHYWTELFRCRKEHLLEAVSEVGTSPAAVAKWLGRKSPGELRSLHLAGRARCGAAAATIVAQPALAPGEMTEVR